MPRALLLNGQPMCMKHGGCACSGFPIAVKPAEVRARRCGWRAVAGCCACFALASTHPSLARLPPPCFTAPQAEKNYAAMAEAVGGSVSSTLLERRVYVGNLAAAVTEGA